MEIVTRGYLDEQADAIRVELDEAGRNIVSVGLRLIEVKGMLGHGEFLGWVASEFGWDRRQINRFIHVATEFSNVATLGHFDKSALYLLAAPSTPEAARDEAKKLSTNGRVSHKAAKGIVANHKSEPVVPVVAVIAEEPRIDAPVKRTAPPTWAEVWETLTPFYRSQLKSPQVVTKAAEGVYLATLKLCGYKETTNV